LSLGARLGLKVIGVINKRYEAVVKKEIKEGDKNGNRSKGKPKRVLLIFTPPQLHIQVKGR